MSAATTASTATRDALCPVAIHEIEIDAAGFDAVRAAAIYREHGCLVVRGLMSPYVEDIRRDIEATARQAVALLPKAVKSGLGWHTPDGALFLPAPAHYPRPQQIMVLPCDFRTSAAFLRSALDPKACDLAEAVLGPDVELFMEGQVLYKEPTGGHPKHLHQDSSYFTHKHEGPMAMLAYCVDTDLVNGALHVVPGSHRLGLLPHVDTFSHLGLDQAEWPWERSLPICGRAGDAIFFHVDCIHGSKENHSASPRPVFIQRYRRADDYTVVNAVSVESRGEAEKKASEARKRHQRGLMVRGFRTYEEE